MNSPVEVMDEQEIRAFTLEQANRTLPLVCRIVADILDEHDSLQEKMAFLTEARRRGPPERLAELRESVAGSSARLEKYLAELHQIGCLFKGVPDGLVDFYSIQGGRAVFLCWRFGEMSVAHWHELDAGFGGRQRIDAIPIAALSHGGDPSD